MRAAQRRQRDRGLGRRAAPAGAPRRGRAAADPPESRHAHDAPPRGPAARRRRDRAGRRGAHDLRAAVARAHAGGHDRQRLRGRAWSTCARRARTSTICWRPSTSSSRPTLGAERSDGRLRGGASADLDRRPQEVGRHLAQGRAVRDLQRHDHDHRRQADDVAADGQAGRRPAGRARSARGALPHARDPARPGDRRGRAAARGGRAGGVLRGAGRALRLRRARGAARWRGRARRARAADRRRAARPAGRGRARRAPRAGAQHRRRAAAPHAPGAARRARADRRPGAVPARARRRRARACASPRCSRASWAGAPERGCAEEIERFAQEARSAEGIELA